MSKLDNTNTTDLSLAAAAFQTGEADPRSNCWVIDTI